MWGIWGCAWFGFRNLGYEEAREETPKGFRGRSWVYSNMIHSRVVGVVDVLSMYKRCLWGIG